MAHIRNVILACTTEEISKAVLVKIVTVDELNIIFLARKETWKGFNRM